MFSKIKIAKAPKNFAVAHPWLKSLLNEHRFENNFKKCFYDVDVENDVFELKEGSYSSLCIS